MTKTELQEHALQLEVSIYHPADDNGKQKELTKAELTVAVADARSAALAAHDAEEVAKDEARQPVEEEPEPQDEPEPEAEAPVIPKVAAPTPRKGSGGRKLSAVPPVRDPAPELLRRNGVTVSSAERKLAGKHGYPVAIPGGSAFKTAVKINCIFGGGLRLPNSIVILDEVEAHAKAEYLTPVA